MRSKHEEYECRIIHAPILHLKIIHKSLKFLLECLFQPDHCVTGFVKNSSIVDNARLHLQKNYVFNVDLKDFFHSIDNRKIKNFLKRKPFECNEKIAYIISKLCTIPIEIEGRTYDVLPQGSPISPILSNIACARLDKRLNGLARRFSANYSRYCDDITFSSNRNIYKNEDFLIELRRIISEDNIYRFHDKVIEVGLKFKINENKIRIQKSNYAQIVTGLVVNKKINVRRKFIKSIRMWLYLWERYGYDKAEQIFNKDNSNIERRRLYYEYYDNKYLTLSKVLSGRIAFVGMIRGKNDPLYLRLKEKYNKLKYNLSKKKLKNDRDLYY